MKLGKNASDTCAMLSEAYGGEAMKKSSAFEWHKRFKEGHENMDDDDDDDERRGRRRSQRSNENVEKCGIFCIQIDVQVSELWLCN